LGNAENQMKLNQLIAQSLNKPVEVLTIEDVNEALIKDIRIWEPVEGDSDNTVDVSEVVNAGDYLSLIA